jgi:hypothetical protein
MGKYTSLARTLRNELVEAKSREDKGSSQKNTYVNINNTDKSIDSSPLVEPSVTVTTPRPTTLTTLIPDEKGEKAPVICIHRLTQDECAVCSGYVRWLIEDDARISAARSNPEAARRWHREMLEGGL